MWTARSSVLPPVRRSARKRLIDIAARQRAPVDPFLSGHVLSARHASATPSSSPYLWDSSTSAIGLLNLTRGHRSEHRVAHGSPAPQPGIAIPALASTLRPGRQSAPVRAATKDSNIHSPGRQAYDRPRVRAGGRTNARRLTPAGLWGILPPLRGRNEPEETTCVGLTGSRV